MFAKIFRGSRQEVFCKKGVLKACNFIKEETLAQVFSCEFCEVSKNTFFHITPLVAVSERRYSAWITWIYLHCLSSAFFFKTKKVTIIIYVQLLLSDLKLKLMFQG